MRLLVSFVFLAILGAVQALSSSGDRLLAVLEDISEKASFSQLWSDLEGNPLSKISCYRDWLTSLQVEASSYHSSTQKARVLLCSDMAGDHTTI